MKGQGTVIVTIVFLSLLLISIMPLALSLYLSSTTRQPVYENPVYESMEIASKEISRDIIAFFNASNGVLQIQNRGGSDIVVEKMFMVIKCGSTMYTYVKNMNSVVLSSNNVLTTSISTPNLCSTNETSVPALYLIAREKGSPVATVISSVVISLQDILKMITTRTNTTSLYPLSSAVSVLPIPISSLDNISSFISLAQSKGFEIYALDSPSNPTKITQYSNPLTTGMTGGTSTRYIWVLDSVNTYTSISINNQVVRNLWIGYDPTNTSRYNILITATDGISMTIGSKGVSYSSGNAVRIKIYGFTPSTTQGILQIGNSWIRYPDPNIANFTFLTTNITLNGRALRIEIYRRAQGSETGYDPYIMLMNTARNQDFAGVLFTDIDRAWGSYNTRNEGNDRLLDYSTKPLALVYKGYTVSNDRYSAVVLAINYRFHDNEGSDASGTSIDLPIMFVGLVDDNGNIYSYRSYTFRELTRYEDTYPPVAQAQSSLLFVPLPPRSQGVKNYYAFIAVQDPYSYNRYLDDLDFTLYIESMAILPIQT